MDDTLQDALSAKQPSPGREKQLNNFYIIQMMVHIIVWCPCPGQGYAEMSDIQGWIMELSHAQIKIPGIMVRPDHFPLKNLVRTWNNGTSTIFDCNCRLWKGYGSALQV